MIGVNMTGVFKTVRAAVPHLKAGGRGGAIVLTSSTAGIMGLANLAHYTAAKHGVVGMMKVLANELAPDMIRVNSVHPTTVDTDMIQNRETYGNFRPDLDPDTMTKADVREQFTGLNACRSPGWSPSTSPTPSSSWSATPVATSPGCSCPSTPVR